MWRDIRAHMEGALEVRTERMEPITERIDQVTERIDLITYLGAGNSFRTRPILST